MLATCVNMVFSLQRYRREKPAPPFELAGVFERAGETFLLADALGSVELEPTTPALFAHLNSGDLVSVRAERGDEFGVRCDSVRVLHVRATDVGAGPAPKPHVARFAAFVERVRDFFLERGLSEILTPSLVRCPGMEPSLEPFKTEVTMGRLVRTAYLPTSPEIHLKKAMTLGWTDIFEIKSCFRRGEFSTHHENEFLMLEWYRAFDDLTLVEADLRELIATLCEEGWVGADGGHGSVDVHSTDFARLFLEFADGFCLTPRTSADELRALCSSLAIYTTAEDSFNDLFHRIVIDRIEPELAKRGATIVHRFPPSMAALAKLDADGWADRFEFYWRGFEIANAFNEVADPHEQMRRWQNDMAERKHLGTSVLPIDESLIVGLRRGLPPSGGIALGLERLYMACAGVTEIKDLRLFSAVELFQES